MEQVRLYPGNKGATAKPGAWRTGFAFLALALAWSSLSTAQAAAGAQLAEGDAPRHQAPRYARRSTLEQRVQTLTKALDLDAKQQVELRKVLENQREQVKRVWSDDAVPSAYRVGATQAISDKTADKIRALLNDEQKKKFNPPKPPHEASTGSSPSVEDWMNKARPK